MKASTYDTKSFGINSTREKKNGRCTKKNWHQKSIKMCLKLPTEKKYSPKMHTYNKIGPESHS